MYFPVMRCSTEFTKHESELGFSVFFHQEQRDWERRWPDAVTCQGLTKILSIWECIET